MWGLLILAFVVFAGLMTHCAAKRWWEYLIVVGLAALLVVPFYTVTGDVSAVIPGVWGDDADGKGEIILVSVAATLLWPLFAAALMVWAVKKAVEKMRSRDGAP